MNSSPRLTSRPARLKSASGSAARSALGAVIATAVGLAAFVVIRILSWDTVTGFQGIGICGALGAAAGVVWGGPGSWPARVLGGGIGGIVAGYFALAFGEVMAPGSLQWALSGAAYAALFALPMATLVGSMTGWINSASGR
jgi:hypothetical protein